MGRFREEAPRSTFGTVVSRAAGENWLSTAASQSGAPMHALPASRGDWFAVSTWGAALVAHACGPATVSQTAQMMGAFASAVSADRSRRSIWHRERNFAISTGSKRGNLIAGSRLVPFVDIVWITYPQRTQRLTWVLFGIVT